ncbi:MAG: aminomethyltransferase family protein [Candidatus Binatia bacterium]
MAKQLPLSEFHGSNGAVFAERDGWLLPIHFGKATAEYKAVRSTAGLIDRCHRGLLQLTGPDRLSFLQGMLSNDLREIGPGEGQYATLLNQQGKVLADVRVLCSQNSFYLDLWEITKDKIVEHLNRYLVADEVEIADRSEGYGIISIQGPHSEKFLQTLLGQAELPKGPLQHAIVEIDGAKSCVVRSSHTAETGFDLIVPKSALKNVAQRSTEIGKQFSAAWVGEEAQNILRVEAGIARYGVDFTEDNLLLEVGLDHAVSFKKGCYLGQEVVERIRSRGHVNKRLVGLIIDSEVETGGGDRITVSDREVGTITSTVFSPALKRRIALGYIHKDHWDPGTSVTIRHQDRQIQAMVAVLPFMAAKRSSAAP